MPSFIEFLTLLLTATGLAGLIGMEREMRIQNYKTHKTQKEPFSAGLRNHAMVGALGFLSFFIAEYFSVDLLLPLVFGVFSIFLISHFLVINKLHLFGMSSSFSFIASFIVGVFVEKNLVIYALLISLLFTLLLVFNNLFEVIAKKITQDEFFDILKFLILSFVVLQILPESWIDPFHFFDWRPQSIWLMVMLVASIRFIGYFLSKFIGKEKGILLSGIIGGLVSSTVVTSSVAQESKNSKQGNVFLIPILVASSIMFFRVILEIIVIAEDLLFFLPLYISFGAMGLSSLIISGILLFGKKEKITAVKKSGKNMKKKKEVIDEVEVSQPLHLKSALSFGLFFLLILIISEKISELFSGQGLLLVGAIAGLTDVDAITLAMASTKNAQIIHLSVIFIAVIVNTLVKMGIVAVFGSKKLLKLLSIYLGIILSIGIGSFILFL